LRDLIGYHLTFDECVEEARARNHYYVGFQAGSECWADTNIGMHERVDMEECAMPCAYDRESMCGGAWRNLIYDVR